MGKKDDGVKTVDGGDKSSAESVTVVLNLNLHCEGCAKKVRRAVSHFEGVEKVKTDWAVNKLTVSGNVDPTWLRERVEHKTKKKVELISPQPKKDAVPAVAGGGGGDKKKSGNKPEKKTEEKKKGDDKKPEQPAGVGTGMVVMKFKLHCEECANKVKRVILKNIDGVETVTTDLQRGLVTVKGTMNVKELTAYLEEKLRRSIEIVHPTTQKLGSGDKADEPKVSTGGGEGARVEVNRMEHHRLNSEMHYAMPPSAYYYNNNNNNQSHGNYDYSVPAYHHPGGYDNRSNNNQSYGNYDYSVPAYHHPGGYDNHSYSAPTYMNIDDQFFSDENPNGCSVM